jgi:hypothetical protein
MSWASIIAFLRPPLVEVCAPIKHESFFMIRIKLVNISRLKKEAFRRKKKGDLIAAFL